MLLLQEFDLEIKDRKETENQVAGHLSLLKKVKKGMDSEVINEVFPDE